MSTIYVYIFMYLNCIYLVEPQTQLVYSNNDCKQNFYESYEKYELDKNSYFRSFHIKMSNENFISLFQFLKCGVELANEGDMVAKNYILQFVEDLHKELEHNNKYFSYHEVYGILQPTIGQLQCKEAFELGMKFFSKNASVFDFLDKDIVITDDVNSNYGMGTFRYVLLPMMAAEDRKKYREMLLIKYKEYLIRVGDEDTGDKEFHQLFYPLIKADWEAGKIKLKEK